jgi:hypothetical protein
MGHVNHFNLCRTELSQHFDRHFPYRKIADEVQRTENLITESLEGHKGDVNFNEVQLCLGDSA